MEEARYMIRYEKGNFNSGYCVLEEKRIAVVNRFLNVEGRINVLLEIIPTLQVKEEELSGEMQKFYRQLQDMTPQDGNDSVQTQMDI